MLLEVTKLLENWLIDLTYFMIILVHEPSQTLVTGMLDIWKPRDARSDGDVMSPAIQAYKDIIKTSSLIGRNT